MRLSEGLTVSWSGADPGAGFVQVGGWFEYWGNRQAAGFGCVERAEKGKFTHTRRGAPTAAPVFSSGQAT